MSILFGEQKLQANYQWWRYQQIHRNKMLRGAKRGGTRNVLHKIVACITPNRLLRAENNLQWVDEQPDQNQDAVDAPIAAQSDEADNKVDVPDNEMQKVWLRFEAR